MAAEKPDRVMSVVPTTSAVITATAGGARFCGHGVAANQVIEFPESTSFQQVSKHNGSITWIAQLQHSQIVSLIHQPSNLLMPWTMIASGPLSSLA